MVVTTAGGVGAATTSIFDDNTHACLMILVGKVPKIQLPELLISFPRSQEMRSVATSHNACTVTGLVTRLPSSHYHGNGKRCA